MDHVRAAAENNEPKEDDISNKKPVQVGNSCGQEEKSNCLQMQQCPETEEKGKNQTA